MQENLENLKFEPIPIVIKLTRTKAYKVYLVSTCKMVCLFADTYKNKFSRRKNILIYIEGD